MLQNYWVHGFVVREKCSPCPEKSREYFPAATVSLSARRTKEFCIPWYGKIEVTKNGLIFYCFPSVHLLSQSCAFKVNYRRMVNSPYILGSLDVSEKKCVSGWGRTSVMRVCNLTNEAAIFHDKSEKQCESGIE